MQATYIQKIESFTGVYVNPAQIDELSKSEPTISLSVVVAVVRNDW